MKRVILILAILMLIVPATAQDATPEPTTEAAATPEATTDAAGTPDTSGEGTDTSGELPDEVVFESPVPGLLPEGVEWNPDAGTFLVGSLSSGTIRTVADDGTVTDLFVGEDLASTVGIHVADGKLYVSNSSAEAFTNPAAGLASLAVYDLTTGERVFYTDLTDLYEGEGSNFANDVTVDDEGNAYVTNSFQPVIYKVTPEGEGSVFLENALFSNPNFGLNGIEYHPDGYLLAAVTGAATLVKIPLDDPEAAAVVATTEPIGIDGMALGTDGILYAVNAGRQSQGQEIIAIASRDDWQSAEIVARTPTGGDATTLALRYGEEGESPAVYYVNTYFGQTDRTEYQIVRAPLELPEEMPEAEDAEG